MARFKTVKGNKTWIANLRALGELTPPEDVHRVNVITLKSMEDVCECAKEHLRFTGIRAPRDRETADQIQTYAVNGNRARVDKAVENSDAMIDRVIAADPRLARRPQWERSDDGVFADAGLVASGDDSPCYQMVRHSFRDASASNDPINVVVSTDSSHPTSFLAFVSAVRIAQQFRPVNVWWQGAWLAEDNRDAGYVFLAPLVSGDMDFARLQYVIEDRTRDAASFRVLYMKAIVEHRTRVKGMRRTARRSYLPGASFVPSEGIGETPTEIGNAVCEWLGLDHLYVAEYRERLLENAALQSLPREPLPPMTAEDRATSDAQWAKWRYEDKLKRAVEHEKRSAELESY